jgi:hypothetical protein
MLNINIGSNNFISLGTGFKAQFLLREKKKNINTFAEMSLRGGIFPYITGF